VGPSTAVSRVGWVAIEVGKACGLATLDTAWTGELELTGTVGIKVSRARCDVAVHVGSDRHGDVETIDERN
jgi:hypothetical protein